MRIGCMMLIADRQAYGERALRCYLSQTHQDKFLYILDTGREPFVIPDELWHKTITHAVMERRPGETIGSLRNFAAEYMVRDCDAIAHWDSDDWSHRRRLDRQSYALSACSSHQVAGFKDVLFADRRNGCEAWTFCSTVENYTVGASMMYWASTWRHKRFPELAWGEDSSWSYGLRRWAGMNTTADPAMICDIHDGNTSNAYRPELMESAKEWTRRPDLDEVVAKVAI